MPTFICKTWKDSTDARGQLRESVAARNHQSAVPLKFVTFNGLTFDLPTLETHQRIDRQPVFGFDLHPYSSKNVIDLYRLLTNNEDCGKHVMRRALPDLARALGVDTPADDITGEQVGEYIAKGDYETVARHCEADVIATRDLYLLTPRPFRAVVLDIETVAKDGLDRSRVKYDKRLKDREAAIDTALAGAALDPWASRIVVLSYLFVDGSLSEERF